VLIIFRSPSGALFSLNQKLLIWTPQRALIKNIFTLIFAFPRHNMKIFALEFFFKSNFHKKTLKYQREKVSFNNIFNSLRMQKKNFILERIKNA
jgi:hypothetical protein